MLSQKFYKPAVDRETSPSPLVGNVYDPFADRVLPSFVNSSLPGALQFGRHIIKTVRRTSILWAILLGVAWPMNFPIATPQSVAG